MSLRYNINTFERREIADTDHNAWAANDNPKAATWQPVPDAPAYDPETQHAPAWGVGGWSVRDKTSEELAAEARKTWTNVQDFTQNVLAIAPTALAQVELSQDPNIAGLRALLYSWRSDVWSDHPLIVQGFQVLQAAGILTAEQVAAICAKS